MKTRGIALMFIGAVMLAFFMYVNIPMNFGLWLTGFLISMLIAASGAVMLIVYLAKGIKADKRGKSLICYGKSPIKFQNR